MRGLFIKRDLDVQAALSPDQAVAKLRAQVDRGQLRGRVQTEGCALCLRGLFVHRFYQPIFRGSVHSTRSGCELRGTVRTPLLLRLFVWYWFGFAILWSAVALVAAQEWGQRLWMPLGGLGLLIFGVLFFRVVNRFVAELADKLELSIREALGSVA